MLYTLDMRKDFCPPGFWTAEKIHVSADLSRKDYLSKTILPFHGIVMEDDGNLAVSNFFKYFTASYF